MSLFWERAGASVGSREVSVIVRRPGGAALHEWRGVPVDGTYPLTDWKPGEIVRDTWDLVLPASLAGRPGRAGGRAREPAGSRPGST